MPKALYPVIHHRDEKTTFSNVELALKAQADGIFLIQMGGRDQELFPVATRLRQEYPTLWVGMNLLSTPTPQALWSLSELGLADALWDDNPGLHSTAGDPELVHEINVTLAEIQKKHPKFRFFGSVAFKTQRPEPNPVAMATAAASYGWTPTTSGTATGVAADPSRIVPMAEALRTIPDARLAIASGVTPENAEDYRCVDDFLVSTGVSMDFYNFNGERLANLGQILKSL